MTLNIPEQAEHLLRAQMISVDGIEVISRAVIAGLHVVIASLPDVERAALLDFLMVLRSPEQPLTVYSVDAATLEDAAKQARGTPPQVLVLLHRLDDKSIRVVSINEMRDDQSMIGIFEFEQTGVEAGKVIGRLRPTGLRPGFLDRLEAAGPQLPSYRDGIRVSPQNTDQVNSSGAR
jgi:hypothetical protein